MHCVKIFARGVIEGNRELLEKVKEYLQTIDVECDKGLLFLDDGTMIYFEQRSTLPGKPLLTVVVRGRTLQEVMSKAQELIKKHLSTARQEIGKFIASKWDNEDELFALLREVKRC